MAAGTEIRTEEQAKLSSAQRRMAPLTQNVPLGPLLLPPVLGEDGLKNISSHTYKGGEWTLGDRIMNHFWEFCLQFVPRTIAPNMITLLGTMITLSTVPVGIYFTEISDSTGNITMDWKFHLYSAFCIFIYQTLDALDGKQARRTKNSTPLGQLFDHGCDALTCLVLVWNFLSTLGLGVSSYAYPPFIGVLLIFLTLVLFWASQWEETYSNVLSTSVFGVGVTEAQLIVIGVHSAAAVLSAFTLSDIMSRTFSISLPYVVLEKLQTSLLKAFKFLNMSPPSQLLQPIEPEQFVNIDGANRGFPISQFLPIDGEQVINLRDTTFGVAMSGYTIHGSIGSAIAIGLCSFLLLAIVYFSLRIAIKYKSPFGLMNLTGPLSILLCATLLFHPFFRSTFGLSPEFNIPILLSMALSVTQYSTRTLVNGMARQVTEAVPVLLVLPLVLPLCNLVPGIDYYAETLVGAYAGIVVASYFMYAYIACNQIAGKLGIPIFRIVDKETLKTPPLLPNPISESVDQADTGASDAKESSSLRRRTTAS